MVINKKKKGNPAQVLSKTRSHSEKNLNPGHTRTHPTMNSVHVTP